MKLELIDAVVDYPGRGRALGPLSLSVEPGEIVALAGPSGCGKSTALRLLAGLEPPTQGAARREVAPGRTAVVFQAPTLMPWASALDNVALPLRLAGAADALDRARESLERVGLAEAASARPAQLSGGMAMRVSLARALTTEPDLLLLDEPFAALDAVTRRSLIDDLLSLWSERRPTVVFVTHDMEEAAYLASRVVVLTPGPGRFAAEIATPGELPRRPGFRADPDFRACVEAVAGAMVQAMEAAA